jgi:hypothetical protein
MDALPSPGIQLGMISIRLRARSIEQESAKDRSFEVRIAGDYKDEPCCVVMVGKAAPTQAILLDWR